MGKRSNASPTQDFWGSIESRKVTIASSVQQRHTRAIMRLLARELPLQGAVILDAGCGEGRWTGFLASRAKKVVAIDASPAAIRKARLAVKDTNATFMVGSLTKLPFKDGSFDVTFLSLVLQHIVDDKDFRKAIREIVRVTRPGGRICLLEIVSGVEKKRPGYIALRAAQHYQDALRPTAMARHIGVRFPYFSHAMVFASKKILVREKTGDVRDTYALYERMERSSMRRLFKAGLLLAHYCSIPFSLLSRRMRFLSPERIMVFTVEKPGRRSSSRA